jgi:hypothetical protein
LLACLFVSGLVRYAPPGLVAAVLAMTNGAGAVQGAGESYCLLAFCDSAVPGLAATVAALTHGAGAVQGSGKSCHIQLLQLS